MMVTLAILAAMLQPGSGGRQSTQGLGDTDPLAKDLGAQTNATNGRNGFGTVFELPRRRGQPRRFARVDGAVVAVFSASEYVATEVGDVPVLPAGTVYYVGTGWLQRLLTPQRPPGASGLLDAPTMVDLAAPTSQPADMTANTKPTQPTTPQNTQTRTVRSIWNDSAYRQQRLTALLTPTAPAEGGASSAEPSAK